MDLDCAPSYSIPNDLDSDPDDPYLDKVRVDSDRPDPDKDRPDPNYDEVSTDRANKTPALRPFSWIIFLAR